MTNSQQASYSQSLTNFQPEHIKEFRDSAINDGIAKLNFYSLLAGDEEGANYLYEKLNIEIDLTIDHNNNGTPAGGYAQKLVNVLLSGSWGFEGFKGVCAKLNLPLKIKGKEAKYLSVFGKGNQQLHIPKVTFKIGLEIATKSEVRAEYIDRFDDGFPVDRSLEDKGFWDWVLTLDKPLQLIITEGAKKACSLISAGYLAIGLNGMWGWGWNVKALEGEKADKYGNKLDDKDKAIKLIHPDLVPFLKKNIEIVWALDRDENLPDYKEKTIRDVKTSKALFKTHCGSLVEKISDTVWEKYKGVDDLITAEGVGAFEKAYAEKLDVKLPAPKKEPKPSSLGFSSSIETGLVAVALGEDGKELLDKDGKPKSERIGNHLIAIATLNNTDKNESAFLLEFQTFDSSIRKWTMPRGYISGDGNLLITELYGREYSFVRDKKSMLLDYLSTLGASIEQKYVITDSSGRQRHSVRISTGSGGDGKSWNCFRCFPLSISH